MIGLEEKTGYLALALRWFAFLHHISQINRTGIDTADLLRL